MPGDIGGDEADEAHIRADLIDGLAALGVWPSSARKAVADGTVTTDRDLVRCKRFVATSNAGTLWTEYLSVGKLPPLAETSPLSLTEQLAHQQLLQEIAERDRVADAALDLETRDFGEMIGDMLRRAGRTRDKAPAKMIQFKRMQ